MRRPTPRASLAVLAISLGTFAGCSCGDGPEPLEIVASSLADATAGNMYSATITATGGKLPRSFTATGVPAGLSFDPSGQLRGAPEQDGDFTLQVTVEDGKGQTAQRDFPLKVFPALAITTTSLATATEGTAYSATVAASGGKPPVTLSMDTGTLPAGLTFAGGTISGTTTAAGTVTLGFGARDANGATASRSLDLTVQPSFFISTTALPGGYVGRSYTTTLAATGGRAPLAWSYESGVAPAGTGLMSDGTIAGTPEVPGTTSFTVKVTDADNKVATKALSMSVVLPPAIVPACPDGYRTEAYSAQWTVSGGQAPYTWQLSAGVLPAGLSLDTTTGRISGTPTAGALVSFSITARDASSISDTKACSLGVYDLPAITNPATLPDWTAGAAATGAVVALGGKSPLTYTAVGLPPGVSLDPATGAFQGTLSAAVTNGQAFSFAVEVSDANGRKANQTFGVTAYRAPVIDTTSLPDATEYAAYQPNIQAHDGKPPLTFQITGLPGGVSFDGSTGYFAGAPTPNTRGNYTLSVTVTDGSGRQGTAMVPLVVRPGNAVIATASPDFGSVSGGTRVTLNGSNLFGATVTVAGQPATVASVSADGTAADITIPSGTGPGAVTVALTNSSSLSTTTPFTYTLERTIDVDGLGADWAPAYRVGANPGASTWGPLTDLAGLYMAYDADNLYVAVDGKVDWFSGATILLYIDTDPGSGFGVTNFATLADNNGELDNACANDGTGTGQWVRVNARFAPEFCAGTKDMNDIPLMTGWPLNEYAGLRQLSPVTDYRWAVDYVGNNLVAVRSNRAGAFTEFLLPWATLYPFTGAPPPGAHVALVARIVDSLGNAIADQTLPQDDDANPQRLSQIAEVDVKVTPPAAAAPPWYQGSVFYELFVRSFRDSNGDGHGDLAGLISKLDYLNDGNPATTTDLGVDALWLMPVFESPSLHGYDATDYERIEQDYGTMADFQAFVTAAHQRGMKVFLDLALNHTSDQHPWFLDSASSPAAAHRDWYVWSGTDPGWTQPWSGDPVWHSRNGAWYYALFFNALPDLNYRTTAVRDEMKRLAALWLARGADGYRLDATPYLVEDGPGAGQDGQQNTPETHQFLRELRGHLATVSPNAAVVAENWLDTESIGRYYGSRTARGGDEVQMSFDFPLADRMVESLFIGNSGGVASKLVELRAAYPFDAVDAPFINNHDKNRLASAGGPGGLDQARLGLAAAMLLTMPGTPFIYYGEEIGAKSSTAMGDDSKRAPMAWDATGGGGFTSGMPWTAFAPGQGTANVASQTGISTSLLSRYRQLIRLRKSSQALSVGQGLEVASGVNGTTPVLVLIRTHGTERVVVAHNVTNQTQIYNVYLRAGSLEPLFTDPGSGATLSGSAWILTLPAYGSAVWREHP